MASELPVLSLKEAGVTLIDCDHRTPPAADSGYPYVAIPQLQAGRILVTGARRITQEHYQEWTRKAKPREDDVVLSRRCNPGETAYVPIGLEFALGQNLVLLRSDGNKIYPPFLRWRVRGPEWWEQIGKFLNVGAVFDSLRCADVPNFSLKVPPLDEQEAIVGILGPLDNKIELNRKMNETLEAMARALFKSWFVDFDPVRAKAEGRDPGLPAHVAALFSDSFEDSELNEIPKGWQIKHLENICESIFSGGTPSTTVKDYWGGAIPWLSSGETCAKFVISTERSITQLGVEKSSTRLARAGATVIASAGQGNTRGQTSMLMIDAFINQSVVVLLADGKMSTDTHLFFDLERRYEEFRRVSDGHSSHGSLTTKLLAGLSTVLPPLPIIKAFDSITAPIVQRITASLRESQALADLRDTLLPKLVSGEIRVKATQLVEAAI